MTWRTEIGSRIQNFRRLPAAQSKHCTQAATKNVKYHAIVVVQRHVIAGFWRHLSGVFAGAKPSPDYRHRFGLWLFLVLLFAAPFAPARAPVAAEQTAGSTIKIVELPPEARDVLRLIQAGGPFPYNKDGSVFGNREHRLPSRSYGYYREYTVPTPGARDRGPRRIIAGRNGELYYTDDHYRRFRRIVE